MHRKPGTIILLLLIVVVASLVIGLPIYVKQKLEAEASKLLADPVTIESLQLNLFVGTVDLKGLQTESNLASIEQLSINVGLLELLNRHISLQDIVLRGVQLDIVLDAGELVIAGYKVPKAKASENDKPPMTFSIGEGLVAESKLALSLDGSPHQLQFRKLALSGFDQRTRSEVQLNADLGVDTGSITLDGILTTDAANYFYAGDIKATDLPLEQYVAYQSVITGGQLNVDQSGDISYEDNVLTLQLNGSVSANMLRLVAGEIPLTIDQVLWQGDSGFTLSETSGLQVQGKLTLNELNSTKFGKIEYIGLEAEVTAGNLQQEIGLEGELAIRQAATIDYGSLQALNWLGEMHLSLAVADQIALDNLGALEISQLEYPAFGRLETLRWKGDVHITPGAKLQINASGDANLGVLESADFGDIQNVWLSGLDFVPGEKLSLAAVQAEGADLQLLRGEDGKIKGIPAAAETDAVEASAGNHFEIEIDKLVVNKSRLAFTDQTVSPQVHLALEALSIDVANFSTTDQFSFTVNANHQLDTGLEAIFNSQGTMMLNPLAGEIETTLNYFELHELSPYLGGGIQAGRLNLTSQTKIIDGGIDAENHIRIEGMKVEQAPEAGSQNADGQMPLSMALFLLKDKQGIVELDVPIKTDFSDYKFGTGDIARQAIVNAAQKTAITYAQYALLPYGGLLLAKDLVGYATRPKFEPIVFKPMDATLSDEAKDYASKLAGLLNDKPNFTVSICGVASNQETGKLPAADNPEISLTEAEELRLRELARQRGVIVRQEIEKYGVGTERMFACQAKLVSDGSQPRVEINL